MQGWVWFTVVGLVADIVGAAILTTGLFISNDEAIELGVTRLASDKAEVNLTLPAVRDRLRQSRRAKLGLGFLIAGFVLQAVGSMVSAS